MGATTNSKGFRDSFLRNGRKTQGAKMAGKKNTKQKAGLCDQAERAKKRNSGEPEKELRRDPKEQGEPKKSSMTKRRQARKVATMVKRLKKNPEDLEQQPKAEAEAGQAPGGGWDAQQQATIAAYTHSRGMQPQEVLQALVNSIEKTLRKEKGENLAGQTPSLSAGPREETANKPEVKSSPGRGGRDLRERKVESALRAVRRKEGGFPRRPDGKKSRRREPRTEAARALRPNARRTKWRWHHARMEPPPCLRKSAASPTVSLKRLGRVLRARRGRAPRCRWHASMECLGSPLTRGRSSA